MGSRAGRLRPKLQGANFDPLAGKRMCAFHGVKWFPRRAINKVMLSQCSVVSCCLLPLPCYRWILNRHSHSSGVSVVNRSGRGFPATSWYTHYTSKNSRENSCVNPLLFIFQRIENLKSNRRRKVHLCGKWKDFFMISHRCSLSHREYLTAVLSVKVRFLNCRAKKIKVITNLLLLLLLV